MDIASPAFQLEEIERAGAAFEAAIDGDLGTGTWPITVTVTDECADPEPQTCSVGRDIRVHPDMTPIILPEGPTSFCASEGQSSFLDAGPGHASYQWQLDGMDLPPYQRQRYQQMLDRLAGQ